MSLDNMDEKPKENDNSAENTAQNESKSEAENFFLKAVKYSQDNAGERIIFFLKTMNGQQDFIKALTTIVWDI